MAHTPWRITPTQVITIYEDNATQHGTIIDARLAMTFGKEALRPRHLRVGQPEKVAYRSVSLQGLNHAASARSMGPDPSILAALRATSFVFGLAHVA